MTILAGNLMMVVETVDTAVSEIIDAAKSVSENDVGCWNNIAQKYAFSPLQNEQRLSAFQSAGINEMKGALPFEVKTALLYLKKLSAAQLKQIKEKTKQEGGFDSDFKRIFNDAKKSIKESIDSAMSTYLDHVRPAVNMSNIFKNANNTSIVTAKINKEVTTRKCDCCGAPRESGSTLKQCAFCGNDF
ncbi:MAG: hypothetical protein GY787_32850 [Alteromonadales bacterium]|nr:hypothetical protein [Alteromonadales bacterium]